MQDDLSFDMKMCMHKVVVSLSNMRILCILPQLLFPELSRFFNLKNFQHPPGLNEPYTCSTPDHLHKFISFLLKIYITLIYHSYIVHALVLTHLINYDHTHLTESLQLLRRISFSIKSVPSYCFYHLLMILYKKTHSCEIDTVEIDKREHIQDIVNEQLSFFTY